MFDGLDGHVPILHWTLGGDLSAFTAAKWDGWRDEWVPVGTNQFGDALILDAKGRLCEVAHGTGSAAELERIAKHPERVVELVRELQRAGDVDLHQLDLAQLKDRREKLRAWKKLAPKSLRDDFSDELEDIGEAIEDCKEEQSPAGQLMAAHEAFTAEVYPVLRADGRYIDVVVARTADGRLVVGGTLHGDESEVEVREIFGRFEPPMPLDFGPFRRA